MSLLKSRRSTSAGRPALPTPVGSTSNFPPPVEFKAGNYESKPKIMKRVSELLAHRRKTRPVSDGAAQSRLPLRPGGAGALEPGAYGIIVPGTVGLAPLEIQPPFLRWRVIGDGDSISDSDEDDSIDDIRRPSGLGRSVSFSSNRSLPPSPFTPNIDKDSSFYNPSTSGPAARTRAISAPNVLRAFGFKISADAPSVLPAPVPQCVVPPLPSEVLFGILLFLPRSDVARLASTSQEFATNARIVLYRHLDLRTLQPEQIEELITLLAYRQDLAELVRTFECHTWPAFFPPHRETCMLRISTISPSFSPAFTATFTVAFQNMTRITTLVLPSFDPTFLRYHSAFGLKSLTLLPCTLTPTEKTQLFAWLDGQTNIIHLALPNLMDEGVPITSVSLSASPTPRGSAHLETPFLGNTHRLSADALLSSPTLAPTSAFPSFSQSTPDTLPDSAFTSPTLLPSLATVAATPSIVTALLGCGQAFPPPLTTIPGAPVPPQRLLKDVTLNINKTLYTGLRPASLMSALRSAKLSRLVLRFGPAVDRRTVGKMLTAGMVLFTSNMPGDDEDDEDDVNHEPKYSSEDGETLTDLEVELANTTEGADQALYKVLNSILPRYQGLVNLQLRFSQTDNSPFAERPLPLPPVADRDDAQSKLWAKHCPSLQMVRLLSGTVWQRA